jgi:uncharacterized protein
MREGLFFPCANLSLFSNTQRIFSTRVFFFRKVLSIIKSTVITLAFFEARYGTQNRAWPVSKDIFPLMTNMVQMFVMGIALDTRTGTPIVVLNDEESRRALPIWIGTAEASAIIRQLEKIKASRPMTHDLLCGIVDTLGYRVTRVEINDLNVDTYYASIYLQRQTEVPGEEPLVIDSRPSDAIAIALREGADIFVTSNVISEGTISTDRERDEQEREAFREFLRDIKPSDFKPKDDTN